ncbi:MAG: glycine zipper family protein [Rhodocyclaceae bacterium]|nr:glycine zipper family protein [Rhodocyclaceae bacterium]
MKALNASLALSSLLLLGACASAPTGPSVMALPGSGKNFEQFRFDDAECRDYAQSQVGGTAQEAADNAALRSATVGTAVGAVAGAAIGGHQGAGVGAGTGLLVGSMAGSSAAEGSAYGAQRRYDNAYVQCMYAKGDKVPVSGALARPQAPPAPIPPAPAGAYPPPPPPGYAPPR